MPPLLRCPMITPRTFFALRAAAMSAAISISSGPLTRAEAAAVPSPGGKEPPASWVDPDTGHRVVRLTREPGSASFYFTDNGYTPDGKQLVYTSPEGIRMLDLANLQARRIGPDPARAIVVGRKKRRGAENPGRVVFGRLASVKT